jgi:hypothetical protein
VSLRITEIDKQPVSHESTDVTAEMLDHGSASMFKPANDAAQFLGIKLDRNAGRADKVAKQNREMPSLGLRVRRCSCCGQHARSRCGPLLVGGDSFKHPLAVAKRDSHLFEIRLR